MIAFYNQTAYIRLFASMFALFGIIMQTVASMYIITANDTKKLSMDKCSFELLIFAQLFIMLYLISQVQLTTTDGLFVYSGISSIRYFVSIALISLGIFIFIKSKNKFFLFYGLVGILYLPITEQLAGNLSPLVYFAANLMYIFRSIQIIIFCQQKLSKEISPMSVKNAIDALHTGIMFCRKDGHILLINKKMHALMELIEPDIKGNDKLFFERISVCKCSKDCQIVNMDNINAYKLADKTVWVFTKAVILLNQVEYIQVTASNITKQYELSNKLKAQQTLLQGRSDELNESMESAKKIILQEETLKIKSLFHDVLGQRIALLLQGLREKKEPDEELLKNFIADFEKLINEGYTTKGIKYRINILKNTLAKIGVFLKITGDFPSDIDLYSLFIEAITEATTNTVRHGFANQIYVTIKHDSGNYIMRIKDNGILAKETTHEGAGLSSLRNKAEAFGGSLIINTTPQFIVTVTIPG